MNVLLQSYYVILPVLATAFMGWIGVILKDMRQKERDKEEETRKKEEEYTRIRNANSTGVMLILRYMLKRYHSEYRIQGKITYNQYKEWMDIYDAYKALGGNSVADEWNEDVEKMKKCDSASDMSRYETMLYEMIQNEKSDKK